MSGGVGGVTGAILFPPPDQGLFEVPVGAELSAIFFLQPYAQSLGCRQALTERSQ